MSTVQGAPARPTMKVNPELLLEDAQIAIQNIEIIDQWLRDNSFQCESPTIRAYIQSQVQQLDAMYQLLKEYVDKLLYEQTSNEFDEDE